jgi:flagellar FliL protein
MAQEDELPPQPKKKSKLKWVILLFLLLLVGGAAAAYFLGVLDPFLGRGGEASSSGDKPSQTQTQVNAAPHFTLPTFLVNLYDPLGRRYVKLDVELELISNAVAAEVEGQNPRIRDALIMLLSSKTYQELSTQEGKHILRNEILDRINQILGGPKVVRVYYVNFVIQ